MINKTIKELREKKGLTQDDIANRLHMARSTYSKIETGNTKLHFQVLSNIAKALGVPVTEIINHNDPAYKTLAEDLTFMLYQAFDSLSDRRFKMVPYDRLTKKHLEILRKKGFDKRETYENTPRNGRAYEVGPREVFRQLIENFGMGVLFERGIITDPHWVERWNKHRAGWRRYPGPEPSEDQLRIHFDYRNEIEIDDHDYFNVYLISLEMPDGTSRGVQYAERDFPKGASELEVLEYLKEKTGAVEAEIWAFMTDGYDPISEIIK